MKELFTLAAFVAFLASVDPAAALDDDRVRVDLTCGPAGATAFETHRDLMVLPGFAFGAHATGAIRWVGPVWGVAEVTGFRTGPGTFIGRASGAYPTMESSTTLAAMAGLELTERDPDAFSPFVSGALGMGRFAVGDMKTSSTPRIVEHTDAVLAPAFGLGFGLRTGRPSTGPRLMVALRWLSVLAEGQTMNVVPVMIGVTF